MSILSVCTWGKRSIPSITQTCRVDLLRRLCTTSATTQIHPRALIMKGAQIGPHVEVGPNSIVGGDVSLGSQCRIGANVVLERTVLGERCVVSHGTVVGQEGFGWNPHPSGRHTKKPQEKRVIIGNDVSIGGNCTIDCGSWRDTTIGSNTKLDSHVHIGHNVVLGDGCLVAAQVGIAGSVTIGKNVWIGGQAGVAQHITIADEVRIAAKSGVVSNLNEKGRYGGFPALPLMEYLKIVSCNRWIARVAKTTRQRMTPSLEDMMALLRRLFAGRPWPHNSEE